MPVFLAGAAQRNVLIQRHIIAYFGGLAYHHAHAVIYEQPRAYARAGVNLYAGLFAGALADYPRQQLHVVLPEPVRTPVSPHRLEPRIAQHHLQRRARRRIAREHCSYVVLELFKHRIPPQADQKTDRRLISRGGGPRSHSDSSRYLLISTKASSALTHITVFTGRACARMWVERDGSRVHLSKALPCGGFQPVTTALFRAVCIAYFPVHRLLTVPLYSAPMRLSTTRARSIRILTNSPRGHTAARARLWQNSGVFLHFFAIRWNLRRTARVK